MLLQKYKHVILNAFVFVCFIVINFSSNGQARNFFMGAGFGAVTIIFLQSLGAVSIKEEKPLYKKNFSDR